MPRSQGATAISRLLMLATIVAVVAALYVARDVLLPMGLAILLTFLLTPIVARLERLGLGRVPSVIVTTCLTFVLLGVIGWVIAGQIVDLADQLPNYRQSIVNRVREIRSGTGGVLSRASQNLQEIAAEIEAADSQPAATRSASQPAGTRAAGEPSIAVPVTPSGEPVVMPVIPVDQLPAGPLAPAEQAGGPAGESIAPVPVEVIEPGPSSFQYLASVLTPLLAPLGTAAVVIVFVIFMLIQREDLRDRVIRLAGEGRLDLTTQALDDASRRISRYLLMQLLINATYGAAVMIGLLLIGLPNAILWGLIAGIIRFVPYLGPILGATLPILLSFAVFADEWARPLIVVGMFLVFELVSNNVMEPLLYGSSTGMSAVAILVAAVFWTWLWGPVGLLLSTPMTVCLVVMGRYVPALHFLFVLLGDEPVLDPPVRIYQRLLAEDVAEVIDVIREYLDEHPDYGRLAVYDELLVPAIHMAEIDYHRGRLDEARRAALHEDVTEVLDELDAYLTERARKANNKQADVPAEPPAPAEAADLRGGNGSNGERALVFCLPVRDEADELVAEMLVRVLADAGLDVRRTPAEMLVSEKLDHVDQAGAPIVCLSAVPPATLRHTRHLTKRLRSRAPQARVIIGLWDARGDLSRVRHQLCDFAGCHQIVTALSEVLQTIRPSLASRIATTTPRTPAAASPPKAS